MWERTKRLINSYLDDLIERVSGPDKDVRRVTRAEMARLNELEVQALADAKMLEKELAEVELRIIGASERESQARQRGDSAVASAAASEVLRLGAHRDLLKRQIAEAGGSAARARSLREERRRLGDELAGETHLTSMREKIAGIGSAFDPADPSATIDEMRERIGRSGRSIESRVADADREMEERKARDRIEEELGRYKKSVAEGPREPEEPASRPGAETGSRHATSGSDVENDEAEPKPEKSLGRRDGPSRPID